MTEDEHPGPAADEEAEPSEDEASSAQPETQEYSQSPGRLASEGLDGEEGIEPRTSMLGQQQLKRLKRLKSYLRMRLHPHSQRPKHIRSHLGGWNRRVPMMKKEWSQ